MITTHDLANAAAAIAGATILWWLVFFGWKEIRVDALRQELFALRDEVFDAAADGLIAFDHPAYGTFRNTLNGFLRFAHRVSPFEFFLWYLVAKYRPPVARASYRDHWARCLRDLTPPQRQAFLEYRRRMHEILMRSLFRSPLLIVLLPIGLLLRLVRIEIRVPWFKRWMRSGLYEIDATAATLAEACA